MLWAFLWRWIVLTIAATILAALLIVFGVPVPLLLLGIVIVPTPLAFGLARTAIERASERRIAEGAEAIRRATQAPPAPRS